MTWYGPRGALARLALGQSFSTNSAAHMVLVADGLRGPADRRLGEDGTVAGE
jgi:hypothetical protein